MKYEINSRKGYHETMIAIYKLMDKGEANLSVSELKKLAEMSVAAEKYEDEVLGLQPKKIPESIVEIVELKMFENKMTQAKLASAIGIGQSKISDILAGKRKPDIPFLKGVYKALKIDGNFLLEHL
ncbi:MAG: helix-turn-helix domain-containing protein [Terrimonas sp.]|uniref:helix-turn-helix domain-containing protein n=1 Tax=Terrimonas sp. TaxID=1914338 RepID=UPI00092C92FC|nr:helix-turn-helix transcriptional regulator [Terrimonas sp.]MBN8785960.1 helix-turn-helix domain-containing protein [Terrimonas sp.]OJY81291.1 MAG: transcriptional regulator [Sphingobacteriales bacterium 40-81]PVD51364.1 transcriptional regulator [Terrimonas sp.]